MGYDPFVMKSPAPYAALFLAGLLSLPASAMLTRVDRDDEEYRELATRYPAAIRTGGEGGAGALIAPLWVLTAAHQAQALRAARAPLRIGGRAHEVREIIVHPDWKPGGEADLALLFLREPVSGIEPVAIYRDSDEAGQTARIVGYGESGRIGGPAHQRQRDGQARAAINTVDRVLPRVLGMRIKGPEDASDLQGALADGDGGAPAIFEVRGRAYVAGIASSPGAWETYTRVSAFAGWIDETMFRIALQEAAREEAERKSKARP